MSVQVVRWDVSMLPKAATCYNALQLPPYPSEGIMRQVSIVPLVATICSHMTDHMQYSMVSEVGKN